MFHSWYLGVTSPSSNDHVPVRYKNRPNPVDAKTIPAIEKSTTLLESRKGIMDVWNPAHKLG